MGGKTLDQFHSRQQARNKKVKDTKNSSFKGGDQDTDDFMEKNAPPLVVK